MLPNLGRLKLAVYIYSWCSLNFWWPEENSTDCSSYFFKAYSFLTFGSSLFRTLSNIGSVKDVCQGPKYISTLALLKLYLYTICLHGCCLRKSTSENLLLEEQHLLIRLLTFRYEYSVIMFPVKSTIHASAQRCS